MSDPIHRAATSAEHERLIESEARRADWKNWGPYVADRAWGTVREDYSRDGDAWRYFPHEHARSRVYRWNEDGIAGLCNRHQNLCLAFAFWNGVDRMLKERFFGVTGHEGNHAEDVKEYYFHLDGVPSHAYMKMLYVYPQVPYPYEELVAEGAKRGTDERELELVDVIGDALGEGRYFDIVIEQAKVSQDDLIVRITAYNRGPDPAPLHVLPQLWFPNTWSWGHDDRRPALAAAEGGAVRADERHLGTRWLYARSDGDADPALLFTENETNHERVHQHANTYPYVKDAFHDAVVEGRQDAVNPAREGTKAAYHFCYEVPAGGHLTVDVRLADHQQVDPFAGFDNTLSRRLSEADEFHAALSGPHLSAEERDVQRRVMAGLLWTKQFYHYSVEHWVAGDPASPPPPPERLRGRNHRWRHLYNRDVISMPDGWEYPWYAAWDLAFHVVPIARMDPEWAKRQLVLMLREWYMHPNGQIPAYEWALGDVNPPVHAWGTWQVYEIAKQMTGRADTQFLERVFHKLLLNFTWWVNRKDRDGNDIFAGGFLGLDNIGVFDRSRPLPTGGHIEQADSTGWMAMFSLNMLRIALELAQTRPAYEDVATKFLEHFLAIAKAMRTVCPEHPSLWDEEDGFFHDVIHLDDDTRLAMKIRSMVGLVPLFAVQVLEPELLEKLPRFRRRLDWLGRYRPHLADKVHSLLQPGEGGRRLLSILDDGMLSRVLERVLDPEQFLSDHGLRALSREHEAHPFVLHLAGERHEVRYEPGDSSSRMFGGNSNWRGPVWFPLNFMMVDALASYHRYYGETLTAELPAGSGRRVPLGAVSEELARRLIGLFLPDPARGGWRPALAGMGLPDTAEWKSRLLFHEYFHGDDGTGRGASHQTGWTALVAELIRRHGGGAPVSPDAS
ncbi:MAG: glucosidase [Pseudomonadota bacterium]